MFDFSQSKIQETNIYFDVSILVQNGDISERGIKVYLGENTNGMIEPQNVYILGECILVFMLNCVELLTVSLSQYLLALALTESRLTSMMVKYTKQTSCYQCHYDH